VSHGDLRKEKDCLNCGTIVQGRYCHVCGQENIEPKETFWHMVTHFFYDITHFDGSFFVTLKDLVLKPGFLSREYLLGRRKKYLHPVRMYVFTSALFFLIFFSMYHISEKDLDTKNGKNKLNEKLIAARKEAFKEAKTSADSAKIIKGFELAGLEEDEDQPKKKKDSILTAKPGGKTGNFNFSMDNSVENYSSVEEYDSLQRTLPKSSQDKGISRMIMRKAVDLNVKYDGDQRKIFAELINTFLHSFPYLLFVSLPLFAWYLKLLYFRKRKEYFFADHGVFLIHLYIFTFLLMLAYFGIDKLDEKIHWGGLAIVQTILLLAGIFYTLKAIKNFYKQGWGKTIIKFILFNIICIISIWLLFAIFLAFSFYKI
jgi:hypothetical protein